MTVPNFFNTEFRFGELGGNTDVQTVLDFIKAELLALTSPWIDLGGDELESPVVAGLADQRSMRVLLTRISATRLGFHGKTNTGLTVIDGALDMALSPGTARVFSGSHHLCVEIEDNGGTKEHGYIAIVEPTPFPISSLGDYIACSTRRTAAGANLHVDADEVGMRDVAATTDGRLMMHDSGILPSGFTTGGSTFILPCEIRIEPSANVHRNAGKITQFIIAPPTAAPGSSLIVPLDESITGEFFILGLTSPGTAQAGRIAVRKA